MSELKLDFRQLFYMLFGFEKTRSWRSRVLIIGIHIIGWLMLFMLPLMIYPLRVADNRFFYLQLLDKSLLVAFFYLNYYVLIPRFFERRKKPGYFFVIAMCLLIYLAGQFGIITVLGPPPPIRAVLADHRGELISPPDSTSFSAGFSRFQRIAGDSGLRSPMLINNFGGRTPAEMQRGIMLRTLSTAGGSFMLVLLMGGFFRMAYSLIRSRNEKKALENANLNAELNFLKSQINPHFLFNTLNGIYAQAHEKSEQTEHSVLKLSELLRYVIYESGTDKVDLQKDLQYISNYIDLQKMRLSSKVTIDYKTAGDPQGKSIAPLLLIAFIENAFKHGISYSKPSVINIKIKVFDERLTLFVSNPLRGSNIFAGGLGLKNVTRRLELLYPGKHHLNIRETGELYIVELNLDINHD